MLMSVMDISLWTANVNIMVLLEESDHDSSSGNMNVCAEVCATASSIYVDLLDKWKLWPAGGARRKVRGSL